MVFKLTFSGPGRVGAAGALPRGNRFVANASNSVQSGWLASGPVRISGLRIPFLNNCRHFLNIRGATLQRERMHVPKVCNIRTTETLKTQKRVTVSQNACDLSTQGLPGQPAAAQSKKWAPERSESKNLPQPGLGLQPGAHFGQEGSDAATTGEKVGATQQREQNSPKNGSENGARRTVLEGAKV